MRYAVTRFTLFTTLDLVIMWGRTLLLNTTLMFNSHASLLSIYYYSILASGLCITAMR